MDGFIQSFRNGDYSTATEIFESATDNEKSMLETMTIEGEPPIHFMISPEHTICLNLLRRMLSYSNINARNSLHWTPLLIALIYRRKDAALLLINLGADLTLSDKWG